MTETSEFDEIMLEEMIRMEESKDRQEQQDFDEFDCIITQEKEMDEEVHESSSQRMSEKEIRSKMNDLQWISQPKFTIYNQSQYKTIQNRNDVDSLYDKLKSYLEENVDTMSMELCDELINV